MKKILSLFCFIVILLSITQVVFAGDVPESLLYEDGAKIFFAELTASHLDAERPYVEVSPVNVIKGNVKIGLNERAYNVNTMGDFELEVGQVYLVTYFDEANPTDIFETTSQNTKTLKLKHITGDMWERFEAYLNEGEYEKAESKRQAKMSKIRQIQNAKVLSDMFLFEEDEVDKIEIVYPGEVEPRGCLVDANEFFKIAKTITLHPNRQIDPIDGANGIWIVAIDKKGERMEVWLDKKGRVGSSLYETSSAVTTQYDISKADYIKLYAFLPEEATAHMPLKNPMKGYVAIAICAALLIFAVAFYVGYIAKKRRQKK